MGSKRQSTVNWIITGDDYKSSLKVKIYPDIQYKKPFIKWLIWNLYIRHMIQSYINHVIKSIKYNVYTGEKVQPYQFGKHSWFSV